MASIYGLYDTRGRLRYIGKAENPERRLSGHMRETRRRHSPLYSWLRKHGKPEMRILEAGCCDWREAERRHIATARANGEDLLNLAEGGDQPFCPPEIRSANGKALTARLKADPALLQLRDAKRQLAYALKAGMVRNETRAKMRELALLKPSLFGEWRNLPDRLEDADGMAVAHG